VTRKDNIYNLRIIFFLNYPSDINFYQNKFYIVDKKNVSICNLQLQRLSSFPLPELGPHIPHLTVDNNLIYVTGYRNQVCIYMSDGTIQNTMGSIDASSAQGEFNNPCGLTVNDNTLYICDSRNHRIETFFTQDDSFVREWGRYGSEKGQFKLPYIIYCCEDIVYVGDNLSVQLFTSEGLFIQRIGNFEEGDEEGEFNDVCGVCVVNDKLYVSDHRNTRIQVFERN